MNQNAPNKYSLNSLLDRSVNVIFNFLCIKKIKHAALCCFTRAGIAGMRQSSMTTVLEAAVYLYHPDFAGKVSVWWGDPLEDHGLATLEKGDVMPIGNGVVLIGMNERTSRQAISQLAATLFKNKAVTRIIVAAMPKLRAAMDLDTAFTFADRDCVLIYPKIVNQKLRLFLIVQETIKPRSNSIKITSYLSK